MDPLNFSIHPAADGSDLGLGGGFFFQGKQAKSAATFVLDIHTKSLRRNAHNLADINIRSIKSKISYYEHHLETNSPALKNTSLKTRNTRTTIFRK